VRAGSAASRRGEGRPSKRKQNERLDPGGGPLSTNAVYHFPDVTRPLTLATFTDVLDEGVPEHRVARLAAEGV